MYRSQYSCIIPCLICLMEVSLQQFAVAINMFHWLRGKAGWCSSSNPLMSEGFPRVNGYLTSSRCPEGMESLVVSSWQEPDSGLLTFWPRIIQDLWTCSSPLSLALYSLTLNIMVVSYSWSTIVMLCYVLCSMQGCEILLGSGWPNKSEVIYDFIFRIDIVLHVEGKPYCALLFLILHWAAQFVLKIAPSTWQDSFLYSGILAVLWDSHDCYCLLNFCLQVYIFSLVLGNISYMNWVHNSIFKFGFCVCLHTVWSVWLFSYPVLTTDNR